MLSIVPDDKSANACCHCYLRDVMQIERHIDGLRLAAIAESE